LQSSQHSQTHYCNDSQTRRDCEDIAVQPIPLKSDRVADAESAPAHQQGHGAEPAPDGLDVDHATPWIAIDIRRVKNPMEFVAREIVGRNMNDFDFAKSHARILSDVTAADAGPEKANQAGLLLLLGQTAVRPRAAEGEQDIKVDLVQVVESREPWSRREAAFGRWSRVLKAWRIRAHGCGHRPGMLQRPLRPSPSASLAWLR
jgi:hypothetical protein